MNTKAETMRNKIVSTADDLFYRQGFNLTSFADISKAVGISRGNFYYHFKTKDDILAAVLDLRKARIKSVLNDWTKNLDNAHDRLEAFINMVGDLQDKIIQHGCPMGTTCSELNKLKNINFNDATEMIVLFRDWLVEQIKLLDYDPEVANHHAMHILTCTQGLSVIGHAFKDADYINREVATLKQWARQL